MGSYALPSDFEQCSNVVTYTDRAWIMLYKSRRCSFENSGSVFHAVGLSRKEAEIFLVETLDQENIIVKKSCGMWRWNWSLLKWQGNIFIPVTAMWYFKNVSSWAKAVGASTFCNTHPNAVLGRFLLLIRISRWLLSGGILNYCTAFCQTQQ